MYSKKETSPLIPIIVSMMAICKSRQLHAKKIAGRTESMNRLTGHSHLTGLM